MKQNTPNVMALAQAPVVMRKPQDLKVHPDVGHLPAWAKESEEFQALVRDVDQRGIDVPLMINERNQVIDGRHRLRAAQELGWIEEMPCQVVPDSALPAIVKASLCHRRHYPKGTLAYIFLPYWDQAVENGENRKKANVSRKSLHDTIGEMTTEEVAEEFGISREVFFRASRLRVFFAENPDAKAEWEPRILSGEVGLEAPMRGIGGREATKGQPRAGYEHGQVKLWNEGFKTLHRAFNGWERFEADHKEEVRTGMRRMAYGMHPEARALMLETLQEAQENEAE